MGTKSVGRFLVNKEDFIYAHFCLLTGDFEPQNQNRKCVYVAEGHRQVQLAKKRGRKSRVTVPLKTEPKNPKNRKNKVIKIVSKVMNLF